MRYDYTCVNVNINPDVDPTYLEKNTNDNDWGEGSIYYLNRHEVGCRNNTGVLQRFSLQNRGNCRTDGSLYLPLDMAGQQRTVATPAECQKRCRDTDGCKFFNSFSNGGCHITTGADGTKSGGNDPTALSGNAQCDANTHLEKITNDNDCRTDGSFYSPLDMDGQGRTVTTPAGCRKRCRDTDGCKFFNSFPNGGCHITTGADGTKMWGGNPTVLSGNAQCVANGVRCDAE